MVYVSNIPTVNGASKPGRTVPIGMYFPAPAHKLPVRPRKEPTLKFVSTEINTDSHALMFYGNAEQYAVKPIDYIDDDFKLITFKPEGNTRETYREESKKESFIYPLRFTVGQEPGSTRLKAHLVAIGNKSTLERLKSAYETIVAHAKPIHSSYPVTAVLLHLAKNEPHSMSSQQLQELEQQPVTPATLKSALKTLQAENAHIPTSTLIHCHVPQRSTNRLLYGGLWLHQGECLRVTFQESPSEPELYWVSYENYGRLSVRTSAGDVNDTWRDAELEFDSDSTITFCDASTYKGRNVMTVEVMPSICSTPAPASLPRIYVPDNGEWKEVPKFQYMTAPHVTQS